MLEIITGRAGSGKSHRLITRLGEFSESSERPIYLIVPRQYSFECDREKLRILGNRVGSRIEVLSFKRLYETVSSFYGFKEGERLTESGRRLVMISALKEVKGELELFKKQCDRSEFSDICLNFYSNLRRSRITADDLDAFCGDLDEGSPLCRKLTEMANIVRTYEALLEGGYMDSADDLSRLSNMLGEHDFFAGSVVAFDGFSNLSQAEMKIVENIFGQTDDILLSVCCEDIFIDDSCDMFLSSAKIARYFKRLADLNRIPVAKPIRAEGAHRFNNSEMRILEQEFLNGKGKEIYSEHTDNITLYEADNLYDECEFVAGEIRRLVDDEGYSYGDISIISRNEEQYGRSLYTAAQKYKIPVFYDFRKSLIHQPLTVALISALGIARNGLRTDEIFNYLKSGFSPFSEDELSRLESYCFVWSVDRDGWESEWVHNPSGYSEDISDGDLKRLARLNEMREQIVAVFSKLRRDTAGKSHSRDISRALYNFIIDNNLTVYLGRMRDDARKEGNEEMAQLVGQVYGKIIDILSQMADALSGIMTSVAEYADSFKLICRLTELSTIPNTLDQVQLGEAGKIRPVSPKAVFIVGANFREFPLDSVSGGLFGAKEREKMQEAGLPFGFSRAEEEAAERFIAYTAVTAPAERLYVSYKLNLDSGEAAAPSVIVEEVKRIFPSLKVQNTAARLRSLDSISSGKQAAERLAYYLKSDAKKAETLAEAMRQSGLESRVKTIKNAVGKRQFSLSPDRAKQLYKGDLRLSPSRFENFNHCAFGYFCRYGLNVRPLEKAVIDRNEKGSIIHYVLEQVLKNHKDDLVSLTDDRLTAEVSDCVDQYVEKNLSDDDRSRRRQMMLDRLKETAVTVLKRLIEEFEQSKFKPSMFEAEINEDSEIKPVKIPLEDGSFVYIVGTVDRVDTADIGGDKFVRVVDYKTGSTEFKLADVPYGLSSQMLIYLYTFIRSKEANGEVYRPAGIFYMPAGRKNISVASQDTNLQKFTDSGYRMSGISSDDPDIITAMDKDGSGRFIKNKVTKSGKVDSRVASLDSDDWGIIEKTVIENIRSMGNRLKEGFIEINPLDGLSKKACEYCEFASVCGNDPDGNRKVPSLKKGELIDSLTGKEQTDGG